uniref:Uncharacterized protein n=1 Tax=Rhipicephalus zambeziensis TaxID=60191 RepID=A0A224YF96_9ACAR
MRTKRNAELLRIHNTKLSATVTSAGLHLFGQMLHPNSSSTCKTGTALVNTHTHCRVIYKFLSSATLCIQITDVTIHLVVSHIVLNRQVCTYTKTRHACSHILTSPSRNYAASLACTSDTRDHTLNHTDTTTGKKKSPSVRSAMERTRHRIQAGTQKTPVENTAQSCYQAATDTGKRARS